MHKDTKYVLFLDDDVRLHPGSIGALTTEMEKNPDVISILKQPFSLAQHASSLIKSSFHLFGRDVIFCLYACQIFIQTGYPLDLPSGTLGSYCIYGYHMVWWHLCPYLYIYCLSSLFFLLLFLVVHLSVMWIVILE